MEKGHFADADFEGDVRVLANGAADIGERDFQKRRSARGRSVARVSAASGP